MGQRAAAVAIKNMVRVPSGTFLMGSDENYEEERPAHSAQVDGFLLDRHPVTNIEFHRFVKDTDYVTVAERAPDGADFEDADPELLVPGSLVFTPTSGPVPLDNWQRWWSWVAGAYWRTPAGPGTSWHGREHHPVVHVAYEDAAAYAEWMGKDLVTETEWEYAARAGRPSTTYAWGEEVSPRGRVMANTWHGRFPWENLAPGGPSTTPIGRYRSNDWDLVDMIGNVWEWTATPWTANHDGSAVSTATHSCCAVEREPAESLSEVDRRVIKGGSHLCAPSYCLRYRPPARQGQSVRSSTGHIGFRCALH